MLGHRESVIRYTGFLKRAPGNIRVCPKQKLENGNGPGTKNKYRGKGAFLAGNNKMIYPNGRNKAEYDGKLRADLGAAGVLVGRNRAGKLGGGHGG